LLRLLLFLIKSTTTTILTINTTTTTVTINTLNKKMGITIKSMFKPFKLYKSQYIIFKMTVNDCK